MFIITILLPGSIPALYLKDITFRLESHRHNDQFSPKQKDRFKSGLFGANSQSVYDKCLIPRDWSALPERRKALPGSGWQDGAYSGYC